MAVHQGFGARNHTTETGITAYKDGLQAAASAATGYPVTDLETIRQDTGWRPADSDPANSKLLVQLDSQQSVGAVVAAGLEEMTGADDAYRIRTFKEWGEKPCLPLVAGTTADGGITETASWTLAVLCRLNPMALLAASDDILELRNHATTSDNTTRLVQLAVGAAGNPLVRLERMGGAANEQDFTSAAAIDDCQPFILYVSFADAGGSGGTATVYVSDPGTLAMTSIGTVSTTDTFGSNALRFSTSGNHYIGRIELWNRALSADEIDVYAKSLRELADVNAGLMAGINVTEDSGTTSADISGNGHTLTSAAGTYTTISNPVGGYQPVPRNRHQPWRERPILKCVKDGAGTVQTDADLSASPLMSFGLWIRTRKAASSVSAEIRFGFGSSTTSVDWRFDFNVGSVGIPRLLVSRYSAGNVTAQSSLRIDDHVWRYMTGRIDWAGAVSIGFDGTETGSGTGAPAYTANAVSRMSIHAGSMDMDIAGPIILTRRPMSHAEMYAAGNGSAPMLPGETSDPALYLHYSADENSGTTLTNGADSSVGLQTITSSSASWVANGIENPSPGSQIGSMADRPWQAAWEIAEGENLDTDEILLEIFAPNASTLTVYSLFIFEIVWPEVGITGGQDSGAGPSVDITSVGVQRSEPGDTGRDVSYAFAALTQAEASNIYHHCLEARRTRRAGATSPMRPVALIYRAEDVSEWAERCAILIPDIPRKQLDASQLTWEWALTVGGRELRYGSNL